MRALAPWALLCLTTVACGDDDPAVRSFLAERSQGVATASSDATSAPGDTAPPDDTVALPDTTPTDSGVTDTGVSDTTPADTDTADAPDTSDANDTWTTNDSTDADTASGGPALALPPVLAIPWVQAGRGGATLDVTLDNLGEPGTFSASLSGDARLHLDPYVDAVDDATTLTLRFDGATSPATAEGRLRIVDHAGAHDISVWAMAGLALPSASWSDLASGGRRYGRTATVGLETAPFPDAGASWSDDSVNIFVPDGYLDRSNVTFVVHFHGHGTTLAETLPYHKYREQLWASGVNAVLVTPQGPVDAASGNFGKLMDPGGLEALLGDVVAILYRDGLAKTPRVGDLVLTEHSGGYQAVAVNLGAQTDDGQVLAAHLFDGLYGYASAYESFVRAGGWLRSNYTTGGGTRSNNLDLVDTLGALAVEEPTAPALRAEDAVIWFTPAVHGDCTWWEQAYAETLRWGSTNARRGPRIELRTATAAAGTATVTWLAPEDDWTTAHLVETSSDGFVWTVAARADPSAGYASFPLASGRRVRVVPEVEGLDPALALPSDTYWIEDAPGAPSGRVLVVDGFDRLLGGSWTDLRHDATVRVARAAHADAASNEAVAEGELALSDYAAVIWLLGDESVADHTFTAVEQALVNAYLGAGGRVIVSGSEVAYDLGARGNGATFLSGLGAVYQADDANQESARGAGALAAIASFGFGGAGAPYLEDYPDVLGTATGGAVVLQYGNGMTAAAGKANRSAVVGFPLEVIDEDPRIAEVVAALLGFVGIAQ